jgi:hypothetical protein
MRTIEFRVSGVPLELILADDKQLVKGLIMRRALAA